MVFSNLHIQCTFHMRRSRVAKYTVKYFQASFRRSGFMTIAGKRFPKNMFIRKIFPGFMTHKTISQNGPFPGKTFFYWKYSFLKSIHKQISNITRKISSGLKKGKPQNANINWIPSGNCISGIWVIPGNGIEPSKLNQNAIKVSLAPQLKRISLFLGLRISVFSPVNIKCFAFSRIFRYCSRPAHYIGLNIDAFELRIFASFESLFFEFLGVFYAKWS